ncbi:AHS2-domain-containing protein [Aaosphaeria arxii CBS 175.79]|uniref:AHS2-domain-containing protein n=1 Tax=Aaosphaeria arxii CBS 175.79 TaxID=1450172 RepID=A0A6A5XNN2_9PLEO|nr:AHS2-domain-containing protein [Aaosphaeria arxii CBS 175.79]KAF2014516.1 AHS2-domain-containing protein [Aaosphaeria arxii CBS 175.79]
MEKLQTLLIANRGEVAASICKTAKRLGVKAIAIYIEEDRSTQHVSEADDAVLLPGRDVVAYADEENLLRIAREKSVDAVLTGYGALAGNAEFARRVVEAGMVWVGPSPELIEAFGDKHVARGLAEKANVPVVTGTEGPVEDQEIKCYPESRHVEVQVFGNGKGQAIHFGEREYSIQIRHQKIIGECPSPFVEQHPGLKQKLCDAAVRLSESTKYGSAGTVEYLVDDKFGDFFFLGMKTQLQAERGVTELCYGVDIVELMLRQADAQLTGNDGLDAEALKAMQRSGPTGSTIGVSIYAENSLRDHALCPGPLQQVEWKHVPGSRIDTWVSANTCISPYYSREPLIAKAMVLRPTRGDAISGLHHLLTESSVCGPPTNVEFLASVLQDPNFKYGSTPTNFLQSFDYRPHAIDVVSGGAFTLIEDLPGRPAAGSDYSHSGPMDPLAFQIANMLVGNPREKEGLEITSSGPELRFVAPAVVALCGASMETTLDGRDFPMWTRVRIETGQTLKIGETSSGGCRSYLAVYGGFPSIAVCHGSKSTAMFSDIGFGLGGYQGRALKSGDLLQITADVPAEETIEAVSIPETIRPQYNSHWEIKAMVGPHDEGFFLPEDLDAIYKAKWKVEGKASRCEIRIDGPRMKWARKNGGEAGWQPAHVFEYGSPVGVLNWWGAGSYIRGVDGPTSYPFVSCTTVIRAEWWKLGQIKAGDTLTFVRVSLEDALKKRRKLEAFLGGIERALQGAGTFDSIERLQGSPGCHVDFHDGDIGKAIVWSKEGNGNTPSVKFRQAGDDFLIVEYGDGTTLNPNLQYCVTTLDTALNSSSTPSTIRDNLITTQGWPTTLLIHYDGATLDRNELLTHLQTLEAQLSDRRAA